MIIPFQVILRRISWYEFYNRHILVLEKKCMGDSTDRMGHFILLFKQNGFMLPY